MNMKKLGLSIDIQKWIMGIQKYLLLDIHNFIFEYP